MIDARRMEVFAAIYSNDMETVLEPAALYSGWKQLHEHLQKIKYIFWKRIIKWQQVCRDSNAVFINFIWFACCLHRIVVLLLQSKTNSVTWLIQKPYYIKEFKTNT